MSSFRIAGQGRFKEDVIGRWIDERILKSSNVAESLRIKIQKDEL